MKNRILFASLALSLFLSAFVVVSGCGSAASSGGGGGGGSLTAVQIYATNEASKASVFAKGSNVYVVFTTNNSQKLIYAKSTDEGVTFAVVTEEVVGATDEGFCRMVVTDDDVLYAVYRKYTSMNLAGISTIDAVTGTHFSNLNIMGSNIKMNALDMSTKSNGVYVAFNDIQDATPNYRIRITYPFDQANTVGTTTYRTTPYGGVVSNMATITTNEVVFVNNDESAVTGEIRCARTNNGWSTLTTNVVTTSASGIFDTMDMASTAEVLYVCFVRANKLYCAHSPDLGATWMPPVLVSDPAIGNTFSSLVCANGKIYIMFLKDNTTVCLGVSSDGGDTWAVSTLATISSAAYYPEMFVNGTKVYLVYRTSEGVFLLKTTI